MPQQFVSQQASKDAVTPPVPFTSTNDKGTLENEPVFRSLSLSGQQTVRDYLTDLEEGLTASRTGSVGSVTTPADVLREMQNHLLSLVAAYREIGDEEPKAIASALAQFGAAKKVTGGLRRAQARNRLAHAMRKDGLLPALLVPAVLVSLSLLLPYLTAVTHAVSIDSGGITPHTQFLQLGWFFLFVAPFFSGMLSAFVSKTWALRGIVFGAAAAALLVGLVYALTQGHNAELQGWGAGLTVSWIIRACLGLAFVRGVNSLAIRRRAV